MDDVYPAIYRDKSGEESTSIHNDGSTLSMTVRGVLFEGSGFDDFEPVEELQPAELKTFTLDQHSCLCACVIEAEIPITVMDASAELITAILNMKLELGRPIPPQGVDRYSLALALQLQGTTFHAGPGHEMFEDGLLDIQRALPDGVNLKSCITCAFSDYWPAGQGLFGTLACFRDNKDAYRSVNSKQALLNIWESATSLVQETYLCPEFEFRRPGTGYRG